VNLRNLSIKRKLTLLAVLTTTMAVMLTSASFLIYDLVAFRNILRHDLLTDAEIVAYNSAAALAFNDEAAANVQLSALTAKSDLVAALLYRPDGRIFARMSDGAVLASNRHQRRFDRTFSAQDSVGRHSRVGNAARLADLSLRRRTGRTRRLVV